MGAAALMSWRLAVNLALSLKNRPRGLHIIRARDGRTSQLIYYGQIK